MSKSFSDGMVRDNIMVVDALNLAFRWKHSGTTDFYEDYLYTINSLKSSYKAKFVVLACDKGGSEYRKNLSPIYKQNRKALYEDQSEADKLAFKKFLEDFNYALEYVSENTNYPIIRMQGIEADDIATYIVKYVNNKRNIWLISTDKDWDLLISDTVSRFSYVTRKETTISNWDTHYDCSPEEYISMKCLMGEKGKTGDNIAGIEGIGAKRALELIRTYGSAIDVAAALPITSHLKFVKELNKSKDTILLNYRLMDLKSFNTEALIGQDSIIEQILSEYIND